MNEEAFQALPADLRQTVEAAARATETAQWQLIRARLAANYATMRANHVAIAEAPGAALRERLAGAAAGAIAAWQVQVGPDGAAVLVAYRAGR